MNLQPPPEIPPPPRSLANLASVRLDPHHERLFAMVSATNGGPPFWQSRKRAETFDVTALSQVSERFRIEWFDLADSLRLVVAMRALVPCLPDPAGPLQFAQGALVSVIYRQAALRAPQPGMSFVEILAPKHVWLPNISTDPKGPQILCLGASLSAGVPVRELLFMTYGALTLQTVNMDALDPAGVLSREAAEWWQQRENLKRVPLTREPFLYTPEVNS